MVLKIKYCTKLTESTGIFSQLFLKKSKLLFKNSSHCCQKRPSIIIRVCGWVRRCGRLRRTKTTVTMLGENRNCKQTSPRTRYLYPPYGNSPQMFLNVTRISFTNYLASSHFIYTKISDQQSHCKPVQSFQISASTNQNFILNPTVVIQGNRMTKLSFHQPISNLIVKIDFLFSQ